MTEEQIKIEHDRHTRAVAKGVFGLIDRFARHGLTPAAAFEGSVRGSALALALYQDEEPRQIATLLREMADEMELIPLTALRRATQ